MKTIRLKDGKERSALRCHPWIFDAAIARGGADAGETVRVESAAGQFLGWAAYSPNSRIRARFWSFDEATRIDAAFMAERVQKAIRARAQLDIRSDSLRLIHGESDGLPGLVVDRYGDTLVAQFLSCGTERWKAALADALLRETGLTRLYERSYAQVRALEGLPSVSGWPARTRLAAGTGHRRRTQNRLLSGPARQPSEICRLRPAPSIQACAQLLLLHRGLHRRRPLGPAPGPRLVPRSRSR
jgi:23S rRNA (cytosine1962-C5)-methyltransferase